MAFLTQWNILCGKHKYKKTLKLLNKDLKDFHWWVAWTRVPLLFLNWKDSLWSMVMQGSISTMPTSTDMWQAVVYWYVASSHIDLISITVLIITVDLYNTESIQIDLYGYNMWYILPSSSIICKGAGSRKTEKIKHVATLNENVHSS